MGLTFLDLGANGKVIIISTGIFSDSWSLVSRKTQGSMVRA